MSVLQIPATGVVVADVGTPVRIEHQRGILSDVPFAIYGHRVPPRSIKIGISQISTIRGVITHVGIAIPIHRQGIVASDISRAVHRFGMPTRGIEIGIYQIGVAPIVITDVRRAISSSTKELCSPIPPGRSIKCVCQPVASS